MLNVSPIQIEAKYSDAPMGIYFNHLNYIIHTPCATHAKWMHLQIIFSNGRTKLLMFYRRAGLTLTQAWTTANALDTKVELDNTIAKGLKAELLTQFLPHSQKKGAKLNLHFKQPNLHARAFVDLFNGPTAHVDAVLGHEGFLVGAEAGYDVQKAAITRYSAAVGYTLPEYTAAITATNNLSVFSASYYHKVNSQVEAGAKATWDSKGGNNVGLEVASKYRLDPMSFAKVRHPMAKYVSRNIVPLQRATLHLQNHELARICEYSSKVRVILTSTLHRLRLMTAVLRLWHTTLTFVRASNSAWEHPSTPRTSTRPLTRFVALQAYMICIIADARIGRCKLHFRRLESV